jgi:uncharacterized membrane protein
VNASWRADGRPVKSGFAKITILIVACVWSLATLPAALVMWGFTGRTWVHNGIYEPPPAVAYLSLAAATLGTLALLGVL